MFSRSEVVGLGFSDSRLRAADVEKIGRGLYRVRGQVIPTPDEGHLRLPDDLRGLQAGYPASWFSYSTACSLYGLAAGPRVSPGRVHVSLPHQSPSLKQLAGVTVHRPEDVHPGEIVRSDGLRTSSPERVFLEMASVLDPLNLVALGDQLVRMPRPKFEARNRPWSTPSRLQRCLSEHSGAPGIVRARAAAEQVRVGSDSVPETLLRLSILAAGFPEPELQCRLDPSDPTSPQADLAYRSSKVALQYEGAHHFTAEQQAADQWRNAQFTRAGWVVLLVNRVDLRDEFRAVLRHLALVLPT